MSYSEFQTGSSYSKKKYTATPVVFHNTRTINDQEYRDQYGQTVTDRAQQIYNSLKVQRLSDLFGHNRLQSGKGKTVVPNRDDIKSSFFIEGVDDKYLVTSQKLDGTSGFGHPAISYLVETKYNGLRWTVGEIRRQSSLLNPLNAHYTCTCPDYVNKRSTAQNYECKHIIAVKMFAQDVYLAEEEQNRTTLFDVNVFLSQNEDLYGTQLYQGTDSINSESMDYESSQEMNSFLQSQYSQDFYQSQ